MGVDEATCAKDRGDSKEPSLLHAKADAVDPQVEKDRADSSSSRWPMLGTSEQGPRRAMPETGTAASSWPRPREEGARSGGVDIKAKAEAPSRLNECNGTGKPELAASGADKDNSALFKPQLQLAKKCYLALALQVLLLIEQ